MNRHRDDLALVMDSADFRRDSHVRARQPGLSADLENVIVRPTIMLHERRYERRVEAAAGILARQAAKLHALLAEPLTRPLGSMQTPRCFPSDEAITLVQSKPRAQSEAWQHRIQLTRDAELHAAHPPRPKSLRDNPHQDARPTGHPPWMHDADPYSDHTPARDQPEPNGPLQYWVPYAPLQCAAHPVPTCGAPAHADSHSRRARAGDASPTHDDSRHASAHDVPFRSALAMRAPDAAQSADGCAPAARRAWSPADQPLHPEYPAQPARPRSPLATSPRAQDEAETYHGLRQVRDHAHARLESLEAAAASGRTAAARPSRAARAHSDAANRRAPVRPRESGRSATPQATHARRKPSEGLTGARNQLRRAYAATKLRTPNAPARSSARDAGVVDGWERLPHQQPKNRRSLPGTRAVWPWAVALALSTMFFAYVLTLTILPEIDLARGPDIVAAIATPSSASPRSGPALPSEPLDALAMHTNDSPESEHVRSSQSSPRRNVRPLPPSERARASRYDAAPAAREIASTQAATGSARPRATSILSTSQPSTRAAAPSECRETLHH